MKHFNIFKGLLAVAVLGSSLNAGAQLHPLRDGLANANGKTNWYKDFVGVRFAVIAPAVVAGDKAFTISNDGSTAAGNWGGAVSGITTYDVAMVAIGGDTLAASAANYPAGSMVGKIAMIYRGTYDFSQKAAFAQAAGATACVIVNNIGGGPVGMGAGGSAGTVTIPVFMISKADGDAMDAQYRGGATVTVTVTPWGAGLTNDLGVIAGGGVIFHDFAIPAEQLAAGNGNPEAYQNIDGAYIGNFGSSDQSNVKLVSTMNFTPDAGGSASQLHKDSVSFSSFPALDSIDEIYEATPYDVHVPSNGRIDLTYNITSSTGDDFTQNNNVTYSSYTTTNIYSKGRYDFAAHAPISTIYFGTSAAVTWGAAYYVAAGHKSLDTVQFSIAQSGNGLFPAGLNFPIYAFSWTDGLSVMDGLVQSGELTLIGANAYVTNGTTDSSDEPLSLQMLSPDGTSPIVPLAAGSWYWVASEMLPSDGTTTYYLGCDGVVDYMPRTVGKWHHYADVATPDSTHMEASGFLFGSVESDFTTTNYITSSYAYDAGLVTNADGSFTAYPDSAFFANQRGLAPSIALVTSLNDVSVKNVTSKPAVDFNVYPNPATTEVNFSVNLDHEAKSVTYFVIDGVAKHVASVTHNNVTSDKFTLSTADLAAGIYYVSVLADGKMSTQKFIVTK